MEAIVLARKDIKEFDQIITVLTKQEGRKDLISRSVKKITSKNAAHLEPCCFVSIDIAKGKDLDYLVRAIPINIFKDIRLDMHKSYVAQYLSKLVYNIAKQEDSSKLLFNSLHGSLEILDKTDKPFNNLNIFILELVSAVGFEPVLSSCITCSKKVTNNLKSDFKFIIEKGGVCCNVCLNKLSNIEKSYKKYNISDKDIEIINNIEKFSSQEVKNIHEIIIAYSRYHLDMKIPDWIN